MNRETHPEAYDWLIKCGDTPEEIEGYWDSYAIGVWDAHADLRAAGKLPASAYLNESVAPAVGSIMSFADIDWRVLAVEGNKALLISENILEKRPYNERSHNERSHITEDTDVTWETCTLRKYLNEEFYDSLGINKSKIAETKNTNPDNQWYETNGGNATTDKIFLLSLDEAVKYFGDSGQLANPPEDKYWIVDEYDSARIAKDKNGKSSWWLRSPGIDDYCDCGGFAPYVSIDGYVSVHGNEVYSGNIGVRPALWLNI